MKHYEKNYEKNPVNYQGIIIIILLIIAAGFWLSPFLKVKTPPPQNITCQSIAIQIEYVTVLVTPTPDGKLYYANEYQNGIRKIQNPFSFYRSNVSGYKSMKVSSIVYNYLVLDKLTWYNPSDGKKYIMLPNDGKRFLFVFYAMWLDDRIGDSNKFYIPNWSHFPVQSLDNSNVLYYPIEYPAQIRYEELEYAYDFTGKEQAQHFGQRRIYSRNINNRQTAGEVSIEDVLLLSGKSNALSGYLMYEIPNYIEEKNLIAGIDFYSWGSTWWKLKP